MNKCSPEGQECIENNFTSTFNCSVACEGIYADVQWEENVEEEMEEKVEDEVEEEFGEWDVYDIYDEKAKDMARLVYRNLKREIEMISRTGDDKFDRQKFKELISEYKKIKSDKIQFQFDSAASSTTYGGYILLVSNANQIL